MGTAQQKNLIPTYIVELSKLYRLVPESWKSVQANQFVPLFSRGVFFSASEKRMPLNGYRGARGHLWVINQERMDSRGVVLSFGLCLES